MKVTETQILYDDSEFGYVEIFICVKDGKKCFFKKRLSGSISNITLDEYYRMLRRTDFSFLFEYETLESTDDTTLEVNN